VRPIVREAVGGDLLADLITGGGLFIVSLIVLKVLGGIVAGGLEGTSLGVLDKLAGLVFGVARGAALVCVGWLVITAFFAVDTARPVWVQGAMLLPPVERGAAWIEGRLPGRVAEQGKAAADRAGQTVRQLESARDVLGAPQPGAADEPGYDERQRRQMDKLFKPGG
jgi:membrane protein required for colicin V production